MSAPSPWHLAGAVGHFCPRCRKPMARRGQARPGARIPTINHILPKCRGGTDTIHGGARNWELMCSSCNGFLAVCGHCPGAVAAVRAVSGADHASAHTVAVLWRLPQIAAMADEAFTLTTPAGIHWAMRQARKRDKAAEQPLGAMGAIGRTRTRAGGWLEHTRSN